MTGTYDRFEDIPPLTSWGGYGVDVIWPTLERTLAEIGGPNGLDLDPDFQRGHVWTQAQQVAFVEFQLRGGRSGTDILFNQPNFSGGGRKGEPVRIVDGKQRLEAVRSFLANRIPAFGTFHRDYRDVLTMTGPKFRFTVNNLETRSAVLRWYLELNAGGTPHDPAEIVRVRALLDAERGR
jgi:hypothetical protein